MSYLYDLMIDPGHGGKDYGASGLGVAEKDWTLKMSMYQYSRLKELGAKVGITRRSDVDLSNNERVKLVKKARYCMSNHFNAFNNEANGVETIHSIHADPTIAKRLAHVIKTTSGLKLRRVFSRELKAGSNSDYYFMHRLTGSTQTTIVEYGFIDSKIDHAFYANNDNFSRVAEAVVKYWCSVLDVPYLAPGRHNGRQKLYKVQLGAFTKKENAVKLANELKKKGYDTYITVSE